MCWYNSSQKTLSTKVHHPLQGKAMEIEEQQTWPHTELLPSGMSSTLFVSAAYNVKKTC